MKKNELVTEISHRLGCTKTEAARFLNVINEIVVDKLKYEKEIYLGEMGKLKTVNKDERPGRNPSTGEKVMIPARTNAKFITGVKLKESLN